LREEDPIAVAVDLFSGPGGLSLGFKNAGFKIVAAVENDKNAAETYRNNFPSVHLFENDIKDVSGEEILEEICERIPCTSFLVVVAGPPCQPFSVANRQNGGRSHPEATCIDHFTQLISEINPHAFLFENVPNFMRIDNGKSFRDLVADLSGKGYAVSHLEVNADEFGVPQRRRRLFIVGIKCNKNFRFEKYLASFKKKEKVPIEAAISDLPDVDPCGEQKEEMDYPPLKRKLSSYQMRCRHESKKLYNHICPKHSKEVIETISLIKPGMNLKKSWKNLPSSIRDRYKSPEKIHGNIYRRLSWNEVSPTIVHPRRAMLLHPDQNRVISVREAARLQSFPDTFRFYGGKNSQYQQVADAVPPLLAEAVAKAIMNALSQIALRV